MKKIYFIIVLLLATSVFSFSQDMEQTIVLLNDIEESVARFGFELIHIEEFNFGIPGGTNWLVEWKHEGNILPFIYIVDIDSWEIKLRQQIVGVISSPPQYLYYENFPGVTRGNGVYQIGDFNGDRFDEIALFGGQAISTEFMIEGYDPLEGKIKAYCNILVNDGPGMVEFIMYKGMQGFIVYYMANSVWPDPPDPNNGRWFFYTWDERLHKYVQVEEVDPQYIGVEPEPIQKQDVHIAVVVVDEPPIEITVGMAGSVLPEETTLPTVGDSTKSNKFLYIIIFSIGVVAIVVLIIFSIVMKKRKN